MTSLRMLQDGDARPSSLPINKIDCVGSEQEDLDLKKIELDLEDIHTQHGIAYSNLQTRQANNISAITPRQSIYLNSFGPLEDWEEVCNALEKQGIVSHQSELDVQVDESVRDDLSKTSPEREQIDEVAAISFPLEKAIDQNTAIWPLPAAEVDGTYAQTLSLPTTNPNPQRWTRKPRMDLPLLVDGNAVISMPDSGTEDNIISKDLVSQLGITVDDQPENQKEFRLANSVITRAIGRVKLNFKFARDQKEEYRGWFYVFNTLLYPLIIGMAFLDTTETLTLHRHRLQPRCSPFNGPFRVAALNNPKRRLHCWPKYVINTKGSRVTQVERTMANADTGSEVDLISLALCRRKCINLQPLGIRENEVQFADGSTSYLSGKVTIVIRIGGHDQARSAEFRRVFYVLQGLTCDILLGEDFLEETEVFEHYRDAITLLDDEDLSQVNGIFWANTPERFISEIGRQSAPEPLTDDNSARRPSAIPSSRWDVINSRIKRFMSRKNNQRDKCPHEDDPTFEARMDEMDAREAHRRRQEIARIEGMAGTADGSSKRFAEDKEKARIEEYEQRKKLILQARTPMRSMMGAIP